ncbi:uncharacterized protein EV420DRAFT_1474171 [Desarmillaria tabescens]|uniref:FAD/NAD(P)-binding domain-containing protein n=1 Tax=Armillaria tabescens TaxID=1929756 RepID=A0AA39NJG4_ARMTA|nr:uncharacterized protein EV420DRAFT_1474171 [Desarmillaria tabescens]KAK0466730.1 hypothetical protein EV420DRAFT_1474171 [Desarmillaria tabescens]
MNLLWASVGVALLAYCAALYVGRVIRRKHVSQYTCALELDTLGRRLPHEKIKGTAVICGGSVGGLLAARVVIVEPEAWMNTPDAARTDPWNQGSKRSRVMQYESLHGTLAMGYNILTKLFPDIEEKSHASGIKIIPSDFYVHMWGNVTRSPYAEYGGSLPKTMCAGRAGIETLMRRLVLGGEYKNIRQIIGTVTGVSRSPHNPGYLEEVTVRTSEGTQNIRAALVVGPAAASLKWLRREGYGFADKYTRNQLPLDELKIAYDQKLHYSTLQFHVTPELGRKAPWPPDFDGDIILWVTAASRRLLRKARLSSRSLVTEKPIPETFFAMLDMLDEVKDTMTCSRVRFPGSSHIRYERAVNLPSNWVALGDSVMRVNPVYGQGCSKAFYGALCLNKLLCNSTSIPKDFSKKYFSSHAEKIKPIWASLKAGDYAYKTTIPVPGETLSEGSWARWYAKKLTILSFTDEQAGSAMWHVRMLLAPPIDVLQFGLILKVAWSLVKG